ncbi:hypothetical protein ACN27G_13160 [Plantactinospora sp. WMMB334]|uniref:hypothetical protein n=1 Tax=Plantactinospora sp. WMMB334 TaxID=3404119 RepID=UPI003B941622
MLRAFAVGLGLVAAAVAVVVPASPDPAYAVCEPNSRPEDPCNYPDGPDDNVNFWPYVELLKSLLSKGSDGTYSPSELVELVQELSGAISGAQADMMSRLNSQLLNDVRTNVEYATNYRNFLSLPPPYPHLYTDNVVRGALHAKNHVNTVSDSDSALDTTGRAMITLFSAAEVATKRTGSFDASHLTVYRQGLENLVAKMNPASRCTYGGLPSAGYQSYTCTFDGRSVRADFWAGEGGYRVNSGPFIAGPINPTVVHNILMHETSYALAQKALEELNKPRP